MEPTVMFTASITRIDPACFEPGGRHFDESPRRAGPVNAAAERFRFEASADVDPVVLHFERDAVEAAWTALHGRPPRGAIHFDTPSALDGPAWRAIEPTLDLLRTVARSDLDPAARRHVLARIEDTLLALLLACQAPQQRVAAATPHTTASPATPTPTPRPAGSAAALVQRVQTTLRQRLDEPWTLATAARSGGVATRTLQAAFHQHCGMGPMQWLREQRLQAAHTALAAANGPEVQVTSTALRLGFTHLGEFSRAYRERFGLSPRQTLAQRG
jgi:AraC-like DNA-binding protein